MIATLNRSFRAAGAAGLSLALLAGGCMSHDDTDADEIVSALERENGGIDTLDDAPMFGAEEALVRSVDPTTAFADPMAEDREVVAMLGGPDAALYDTAVRWGQIPADPANPTARDWSGTLRVNRGAIIIRRVVRFEDATDSVSPRTSRTDVAFTSLTRPASDGLLLTIVDPEPASADALVLEYQDAAGVHGVAVADLLTGPQTIVSDDANNRMTGIAFAAPREACEHGFLHGRWHQLRPGVGVIMGGVTNEEGELVGHLRGIYGARRTGEQVFFGKYIDLEGRFRGIFGGRYADGHFAGRWTNRAGEVGRLGGEYREARPGTEVGGGFMGRWAETRCGLPIDGAE